MANLWKNQLLDMLDAGNIQQIQKSPLELQKQAELEELLKQQQVVPSASINTQPVTQQQVAQQIQPQNLQPQQVQPQDLQSSHPELFSSDKIWQAARQSRGSDVMGEGFAAGYNQNYTGSGYQGDPGDAIGSSEQRAKITDWYKGYLAQHPEIIESLKPENRVKDIIGSQLENNYGGSQYTPEQIQAAKDIISQQQEQVQSSIKQENEIKMQELKNKGLVDVELAKGKGGGKPLLSSELEKIKGAQGSLSRMDALIKSYSGEDKNDLFGFGGLLARGVNTMAGGTLNPKANQYNQDIGMLKRAIAKAFEGGRMSDQDRAYYDMTLFNPNASQEDFINALKEYKKFLKSDLENTVQTYEDAGRDVSKFKSQSQVNGVDVPAEQTTQDFAQQEGAKIQGSAAENIQIFQDANGNRAKVRVDESGNPIEVIEEL